MRFGKIIISTDADSDGEQIAALIITMFYRLMPELIIQGKIYIAQTPLYEIKHSDDTMTYFYTEKEKDEKLPSIKGKYTIARCKGLGELDAETMSETAMNPETRHLIKVNVKDAKEMTKSIDCWMGINVTDRKQFIADNLYKYVEGAV